MQLDTRHFWEENRLCERKPFRTDKPRCPISLPVDDHWLMDEMKMPSTLRYYREPEYAAEIHRACNDRFEEATGIRPYRQTPTPKGPLRIEEVLGSHFELTENATPWLEPGVSTPADLSAILDRVEKMSDGELRERVFSNGGKVEKSASHTSVETAIVGAMSRGPATIATSVIGTTTAMYWLVDEESLMERFFDVLAQLIIRWQKVMAAERGVTIRGYGWLDDNCALLSAPMYEKYCYPVLERVFAEFSPELGMGRFQHSDSAMGHLMPLLNRLGIDGVNLGPTIPAAEIRVAMPRALIHGQIAPMLLRNGSEEQIVAAVKRDFAAVGGDGGLHVTTAGSIAAGTSLKNIRTFMWAVQEFTRYNA